MASAERRDGKLESFLNRHLPRDEYERLLTKQPCVAVESGEKPAHRHAIVGHCRLYLTDVPPRALKMTVQLRHIESVEMLSEPAQFLQGKEKDEAVHVQVHFTREPKQGRGFLGSLGDLSPALGRRLTAISGGGSRKHGSRPLPSPLSMRYGSTVTGDSVKRSSSVQSLEHLALHQKSKSCSPAIAKRQNATAKTKSMQHSPPFSISVTAPFKQPLVTTTPTSRLSRPPGSGKRSSLEKSLNPSPEASSNKGHCDSIPKSSSTTTLSTDDSLWSSQSSLSLLSDSVTHPSPSPPGKATVPSTVYSSSQAAWSSERDLRQSEQHGTHTEREVLDLYILTPNSDFYHHLCTAWQDEKIAAYFNQASQTTETSSQCHFCSDHFSHHFHTLRQELVSAPTVQESAQLVRELCTACKKYFVIKRLFWESHGLVEFLIEKLQHKHIPCAMHTWDKQPPIEIEYRVMLLDLLYQMLRETHGLQRRCYTLTTNGGRCLEQLTSAVINLVASLAKQEPSPYLEDEVIEYSCGILSEVFKLAEQTRWPCSRESVVSQEWILSITAKHPHIREFCQAVIRHESFILHSECQEPHRLVSLYHMTHVLNYLVNHSHKLLDLMQSQFSEEFKYFISVTQARGKLPVNCPLTAQTLSLLHHTKSKVLHN